jgi:2-phospho-L-lactate guanylyltransferase
MSIVAVVPVRGLADGKSRLAGPLNLHFRRFMILTLLRRALEALTETDRIATMAVISPEPLVLRWAGRFYPAVARLEQHSAGLNPALDEATGWARDWQATALLVMHADLPLVTSGAVRELIGDLDEIARPGALAIAPDLSMRGTNAVLMRPPGAVPFLFGEDSYARFRAAAYEREVKVAVSWPNALSFDLDTPDDFKQLQQLWGRRWVSLSEGHDDARFLREHFPDFPSEAMS